MKAKNIIYSFLGLAAALFTACSQEEVTSYNGCQAGIFIQEVNSTDIYKNPLSYKDSIKVSFADYSDTATIARTSFKVHTIGPVVNYDRKYSISVNTSESTAVEGEDFTLSGNDFTVKSGCAADTIVVVLKRSLKLRKQTLRLMLSLKANENFDTPVESYKNSSSWSVDGNMHTATDFIIRFDEKYNEPSYWSWFGEEFYGVFSVNRFLTVNSVMGWTVNDWSRAGSSGAKISYGKMEYAARQLQKYLQKMADAGTPVYDDDETLMQLPDGYEVDYSKYN